MHLSKENLNLYRIASSENVKYALTGVYVNPRAKVTAASDGRMLVEVTAPSGGPDGPGDKESKPFILPAKVAQQLTKELTDGARVEVRYDKDRPVLSLVNGKKATPVSFEPIAGAFPDYEKSDLWSGKAKEVTFTCDTEYIEDVLKAAAVGETVRMTLSADRIRFESEPRDVNMAVGPSARENEARTLTFNVEFLRPALLAAAIGKSVTLSMFEDRLRIESKKDDGQSARGVLMCCGETAPAKASASVAPKAEPIAPPVPEPVMAAKPEPAVATRSEPPNRPPFRWWGKPRKSFVPKDGEPVSKPPSEKQRMFYTYLLRRHGKEITPEILRSTDFVGKIEELKSGLSYDQEFATWPQWKKVNYLLLERKAEPEAMCEVLNGISNIKTASEAIASWSKKPVPASTEAAAAKPVAA